MHDVITWVMNQWFIVIEIDNCSVHVQSIRFCKNFYVIIIHTFTYNLHTLHRQSLRWIVMVDINGRRNDFGIEWKLFRFLSFTTSQTCVISGGAMMLRYEIMHRLHLARGLRRSQHSFGSWNHDMIFKKFSLVVIKHDTWIFPLYTQLLLRFLDHCVVCEQL